MKHQPARSARCRRRAPHIPRPRLVDSGSFIVAFTHLSIPVASLACPADPSSPGVLRPSSLASASHHSLTTLAPSSMRAPSALTEVLWPNTPKHTLPHPCAYLVHSSLPLPTSHRRASPCHSCEVPSPLACLPTHGGPSTSPVASSCQAVQDGAPATARIARLPSEVRNTRDRPSTAAPCRPVHAADLLALHRSPRTPSSAPNPPIPLSPVFAHIPRVKLPTLACIPHLFFTAAQLVLYRHLEHSATASANAGACVAGLAGASHLRARGVTHGPDVPVRTRPILRLRPRPRSAFDAPSQRSRFPHSALTFSQRRRLPLRASPCLRTHPPLHSSTSSSWPARRSSTPPSMCK